MDWRRGVTREVLLTRGYAIKMPSVRSYALFLHGLLANMQEVTWWKQTKDPRLCPVVFSLPLGLLVVMPRAINCSNSKHIKYTKFKGVPHERKPCDFGWIEGEVVVLDYGN